jgi:hypothetical protein
MTDPVDDAVERFLERDQSLRWQSLIRGLEPSEPWTDPDNPDPVLDAAYRGGIVPPAQRWESNFTYRPAPEPDALTILTSREGRVLAKRVRADGAIDSYDKAFRFDMVRCHVRNLADVEVQLRWLLGQRGRCIVRGDMVAGRDREHDVQRLLHARDDHRATLVEAPRQWLAIDIDDCPDGQEFDPGDLIAAARIGTAVLPPEFTGAEHLCQATASHGLKPGLRIRLWFWLARPVGEDELKYWFKNSPVDLRVFNAAQVIYTAAPEFIGTDDPLHHRLVHIPGATVVQVPPPESLRSPAPIPPAPRISLPGLSPLGKAILDNAEAVILNAPRGAQEITLVRRSYAVGCAVADGKVPEDLARQVLRYIGRRLPALGSTPWLAREVDDKISRAFSAGLQGA